MNRLDELSQKYIPAPWRKQSRLLGLFSLVLVMISLVASVYLSISSRTSSIGREIQFMQSDIELINREIEDLRSQIAFAMSSDEMEKRAAENGFRLVEPEQIVYLSIPGFYRLPTVSFAPTSQRVVVRARTIPPEYTESLYEWVIRQIAKHSTIWVQP